MERREVIFSGRVQGVGFRYTTKTIASQYAVKGYVRNLSDGRVELIVEAEKPEAERFIAHIRTTMAVHIEAVDVRVMPASGEYQGFSIRH